MSSAESTDHSGNLSTDTTPEIEQVAKELENQGIEVDHWESSPKTSTNQTHPYIEIVGIFDINSVLKVISDEKWTKSYRIVNTSDIKKVDEKKQTEGKHPNRLIISTHPGNKLSRHQITTEKSSYL